MSNRLSIKERIESLAFRVRTTREDLGLTQPQLAEKAGISPGHVSKIETGKTTNPTRVTIKALAKALEVPEAYLLAFIETPDEDAEDEEDEEDNTERYMAQSPLAKRLMDLFIQLTLRDQKLLVSMAQTLSNIDSPHVVEE